MGRDSVRYDLVPSAELAIGAHVCRACKNNRRASILWNKWKILPWLMHILLFAVSTSLAIFILPLYLQPTRPCELERAPIVGEHSRTLLRRFDGSFDRSSPFKGPPSKEVDEAWERIIPLRLMAVPHESILGLNTSRFAVSVPPNLGTGKIAIFEAVHQIHCVHGLWKAAYPDYFTTERDFARDHPEDWKNHIDHCADMLRQKLMCDADATLITYNWLKGHYKPHPNFNVQHKCRDYNHILDAINQYGIDPLLIPEGGIRRPENGRVVDFEEPPFDPTADN